MTAQNSDSPASHQVPGSGERGRSTGRPTLDQVAALAGVGRGTASRVVNGSPQVSPEAREAVLRAIDTLGYIPNRAARALVTRRADSVALVVSESEERVFGEPFFAGIIRGITSHLATTSMQLWLAMAQSTIGLERVERSLGTQHVDGVMLLSLHDVDPLPQALAQRGLPVVLGGRSGRMLGPKCPEDLTFVDVDNWGGAGLAVKFLLGRGRNAVGTIAGPQDMGVGVARLAGYRDALAQAEVEYREDLVAFGDFSEVSGAAAMRSLLAARPDLDAVFVASDLMAAGAMRALREAGRRIPDDVAVVGFEDSVVAGQLEPSLTTVHQPVEEMGRQMARLLLARIAGEDACSVVLETFLVVRETA
jgi:DNA-binding LacI/PurR family transcriptional regulator